MSNAEQLARKKRNKPASYYLLPLAAAYAALLMPWSILALLYGVSAPAGLLRFFRASCSALLTDTTLLV